MSTEAAKALVREVVEDWHRKDRGALDEHLDPAYVNYDPSNPDVTDLESYKRWAGAAWDAFPDMRIAIEDLIAEGDRVAKVWSLEATHQGEFAGIAPTRRRISWSGITVYRVRGEKVIECSWQTDALGLLRQLGAIAAPDEQTVGASG
jgi:predicted ester cyclase